MLTESQPYRVDPDSELGRMLDRANASPILLEKDGIVYRLEREIDPLVVVDPETTRAAIQAGAGTLSVEDAERLKALIYQARQEGTCPLSTS